MIEKMQDIKIGVLAILAQLTSGSVAIHLFDSNDLITFIARIFSISTALLFIFINWKKICYRLRQTLKRK